MAIITGALIEEKVVWKYCTDIMKEKVVIINDEYILSRQSLSSRHIKNYVKKI